MATIVKVTESEDRAVCHRDAGESTSEALSLPLQRRPILGSLLEEPALLGTCIAVRAAPLRPVVGKDSGRDQADEDDR